ncbi:MAG: 4Fe-4S ferredoxin [Sphaerochaetaceae bacterium]|jgi:NAD-dependent dihydropyrimidine dehydrogenase PreA subunit|nr:4Fe-4S ferredoxin [Sphaerochaetaceae bacterium]
MHAVRNLRLCTKDCLCLFVCPTGATDTETGQIDFAKCIDGCRLCVDACPSHAISLILETYPEPKVKESTIQKALNILLESKVSQEQLCSSVASNSEKATKALATALARSTRILAEDCARESAFMLPQSESVRQFLAELVDKPYGEDFPYDTVKRLLELL